MCHRFYLKATDLQAAAAVLKALVEIDLATRYNIAPSTRIPAIRRKKEGLGRVLSPLRWGLVPSWAANPETMGTTLANARAETLAEKPSFKEAFARRRCIIPASGFFEWEQLASGRRQPWLFERADEKPLLLAGLWESWSAADGQPLETCTVITVEPNPLVGRLHDRMPAILSETGCESWLGEAETGLDVLLRPFPAEAMRGYTVDPWVNSVAHDDERCIKAYHPDSSQAGDQLNLSLF